LVLYHRVPRLFDALARADGRHARLLKTIARVKLLILDDWGLANVTAEQGRDLLEILDDRHGRGPTIVTSQLDLKHWHDMIANPTVADAILDRLVHNAHRLNLTGESLRKAITKRAALEHCPTSSDRCPACIGLLSASTFTVSSKALSGTPPRSSMSTASTSLCGTRR
jgi:hypothetical protein